ncbi:hypothetical protein AB1Y20_015618 [Prymnesium parvum]|uniref:Uncharacterized protein n=1 Tax=Prymnesium parvum TaxID=97485 RepID=A0AB34K0Q7_PRYPA
MVPEASNLLPNLLNATKLGRQRNQLLKWLRHPRAPAEKLLRPTGLTNHYGAKTGLTNQLRAHRLLCARKPHRRDAPHFAYAMRGTVHVLQHSSRETAKDATVLRLESDRGWLLYKGMTQAFRWPDERLRVLQRVERSVYAALRPSPPLNRLASGIARRLLRLEGEAKEATAPPYGCMHTRLERDMRQIVRVNHAGALPSLRDYLSPSLERHFPALRAVSRVFVSVGADIPAPDWRRLRGRTS